jgi:site-specific DNA recombinase
MNAAIYARKSTEQSGVADDVKSVTRQVENARAFATSRGWTVMDEHIFIDDGISGTEFKKRPAFMRMMNGLTPKAPFRALIVSEQKTIGREMTETSHVIKQLARAHVEIFEYVHGRSLTPTTPTAKLLSSVQGFSDEDHAVKTSERVIESHTGLAKAGYVTGGRVFGYTNRDVFSGVDLHGRPLRSHVERVINPIEAEVVQRIFALFDAGEGLKRIAKLLTIEGAAFPKPFVRKDPTKVLPVVGWSPSTVRAILTRELYHGVMVWNRSQKRDVFREVNQRPRPESEWLRTPVKHLRIIDEQLWLRVASRRKETEGKAARLESGQLLGRPPKHATQNLLAGLTMCAWCGGSLVVETSPRKRGRVPEYICHRHRHNGTCRNALHMSVAEVNEAVLQAVERHALTPDAVEQVILLTERDDVAEQQVMLTRERQDIEKRIARLIAAIETGGDAASLVAKLRELEIRRSVIDGEVMALRPIPRLAPSVIENRLAEWRRLLRASTTQARTVLQRVLRGRLTFTPREDQQGYDFTGPTRFDRLFSGIVAPRPAFIETGQRGIQHIGPEDTFEGDYGRLLDRVSGKLLASPTGFEPVF